MTTEKTTYESDDLRAEPHNGTVRVVDPAGGVWYPGLIARMEIGGAPDREATALRICRETPMRGEWRS
jgi:hypothetical protein